MKKFLAVAVCFMAVAGLVAVVGCGTETPAGPDTNATATAVAAAATANAVATANASATAVAVATANAAETGIYTFNSLNPDQTGAWNTSGSCSAKSWNVVVGEGHDSTGCLDVSYASAGTQDASKGAITYQVPWDNVAGDFGVIDMTGMVITAWVFVPSGMTAGEYAVNIMAQNPNGSWPLADKWNTLASAGWNQVTFDLASPDNTQAGWDITSINQIVFQLIKTADGSANFTGNVRFDGINWE